MSEKKKPHYYYEIHADSETGQQITTFVNLCNEAEMKAADWVNTHGADSYYESPEGMAGGISAVMFADGAEHEGWERVEAPGLDSVVYFPEDGSELEKEMYALPVVMETRLIGILNLEGHVNDKGKKVPYTFGEETPVLFKYRDKWHVDVPYPSGSEACIAISQKEFSQRKIKAIEAQNENPVSSKE